MTAIWLQFGVIAVLALPEPARVDWRSDREPALDLADHRQLAFLILLAAALGALVGLLVGSGYGTRAGWIGGVAVTVLLAGLFAMLAQGRKAVYTAPIKALVSEKFFDLCRELGPDQVGMMTGDATVNRDAPVICCTAEVLANIALGDGSEADVDYVVMELEWVQEQLLGKKQKG